MGGSLKEALQQAGFEQSEESKRRRSGFKKKPYKSSPHKKDQKGQSKDTSKGTTKDAAKDADRRDKNKNFEQKRPDRSHINEKHEHHHRTECESCKKTTPDVEYYQHSLKTLTARWLCIPCADQHKILDDCRQTEQSDFSLRKTFRRLYGPTKRFPTSKREINKDRDGNINGNR